MGTPISTARTRCRSFGRSSATRASSPYCGQSTRETTCSVAVPRACCGTSYARTRQGEKGRETRCCFCTTPTGKLRTHCRRSSTTWRDPAGNSRTWASYWLTSTLAVETRQTGRDLLEGDVGYPLSGFVEAPGEPFGQPQTDLGILLHEVV